MTQLEFLQKKIITNFESEKLKDAMHLDADEIDSYIKNIRTEYIIKVYRILKYSVPETMNPAKIKRFMRTAVTGIAEVYPDRTRAIVESASALIETTVLTDVESFKNAYLVWLDRQFDKSVLGGIKKNVQKHNIYGAGAPSTGNSPAKQG